MTVALGACCLVVANMDRWFRWGNRVGHDLVRTLLHSLHSLPPNAHPRCPLQIGAQKLEQEAKAKAAELAHTSH
jgi:hypothetical protein